MVHPCFISLFFLLILLSEQIVDGSIDLDPDYQRGTLVFHQFSLSANDPSHHSPIDVVWSEQKQIGLIDSVFRNYYIPPIIFGSPTIFRPSLLKPLRYSQ